jgi:two-component system LytT family response regulator
MKTMQHFEEVLNQKEFVRVHRSYIISIPKITRIETSEKDTHEAVLKNN